MSEKILLRRLGKRIKRERLKRKLSQQKLGLACGISIDYISKIEKGKINPTIKILHKIAKKLKARLTDFFDIF